MPCGGLRRDAWIIQSILLLKELTNHLGFHLPRNFYIYFI
jgi:hypothetical protein